MEVTLYKRPYGRTETVNMTRIRDEDAKWFESNRISISMEDCGEFMAVYADCGFTIEDDPDEDPDEIVTLSNGLTCEETMADLRERCQKELDSGRPRMRGVLAGG